MKKALATLLVLSFGCSFAQQESFLTRHFTNSEAQEYTDLSSYSIFQSLNPSDWNLIPEAAQEQLLTFDEQSFSPINQGAMPTSNIIEMSPYLGTSTTRTFELLNKKATSTYIFDSSGNLRSTQMNISFRKKK